MSINIDLTQIDPDFPMSTDAALSELIALDSTRIWAIVEENWFWPDTQTRERSYRISLFLKMGHPPDQITATDLDTAVSLAKELHHRLTLKKPPLAIH